MNGYISWIMDMKAVLLTVILILVHGAHGRAIFELRLDQYRAANICCDGEEPACVDCDPQFKVCLSHNITSNETCQTTSWINDTMSFDFSEISPNIFNLTIESLKGSIEVEVVVGDYDNESQSDPMDTLKQVLTAEKTGARKIVMFGRNNYSIRIVAVYTIVCEDSYYGDMCDVFCMNNTNYYCDENGRQICLPGFIGIDCAAPTTSQTAAPTEQSPTMASITSSTMLKQSSKPDTTLLETSPSTSASSSSVSVTPLSVTVSSTGPFCYQCQEMGHLIYCDTVMQCRPNEVCFVSKYIKGSNAVFQSGCLPKEICTVQQFLASNISSECVECCSEDYCNNKGCGDDAYVEPGARGPLCLDCRDVGEPAECHTVTLCQKNQLCGIEEYRWGDDRKFSMGCSSKLCLTIVQSDEVSARSVPLCHSCCSGDHCNRNCSDTSHSAQTGVLIG